MAHCPLILSCVLVTMLGCGNIPLTEPVTAITGSATPIDGYEAALATAEANGYPVVMRDPSHSFLRVQTRSVSGLPSKYSVYFDIKSWRGSVDVLVRVPPGLALAESQIHDLLGERKELAWAISKRARMLAGEPFGDVEGNYSSLTMLPAMANQHPQVIIVPPTP